MSTSLLLSTGTQRIFEITNDLSNLLAVGTLNFINFTDVNFDLNTIKVDRQSNWKWLDLYFLPMLTHKYNSILDDIRFLIDYGYFKATFKIFKSSNGNFTICKVRLYAIPVDIPGYRFINDWRSKLPLKLHTVKKYKQSWYRILPMVDFNHVSWSSLNGPMLLIDFLFAENDSSIWSNGDEIKRWINHEWFSFSSSKIDSYSFIDTVKRIYNSVLPPDLSNYINKPSINKVHQDSEELIINLLNSHVIQGVHTNLYPYQIRSICKMLEFETISRVEILPNFIKLKQVNNSKQYYFDISSTKFYRIPEIYQLPKGGILAENMGLGKTLMCLALICLTKYDVSSIPTDILLYSDSKSRSPSKLKSLFDLCAISINQKSLPWKIYTDDLPTSIVNRLQKPGFFRVPLLNYWPNSNHSLRSRDLFEGPNPEFNLENGEGKIYKTVYLSNSTLIIVPDNLFTQWINEINKHLHEGFLHKLFISSQIKDDVVLPNTKYAGSFSKEPLELLNYDLVLATTSSISKEVSDSGSSVGRIYWKRLIIDEGHSVNSKVSRVSHLCDSILSERRWAVSGTPTSGLTNLYMDEDVTEGQNSSHSLKKKYVVKNHFSEKADLLKLGSIVGNFLRLEPYHLQPKLWNYNVVKPIESGVYGSDLNLINMLNDIMVRHVQVDMDVQLPQLHHEVVFIEPSLHNKLSINLFTAVLAVNAVSSERTGVDYMFDSSNKAELRLLISNLQRATFHWTGFKQRDVESLIGVCNTCLKKHENENLYSSYDISLLKKSIEISKVALNSPRWRVSSLVHEMNYFLEGLGNPYIKYFSIGSDESNRLAIFGASHINAIQEFVYKNRFIDEIETANIYHKLDEHSKKFWKTYWRDNVKRNEIRFNKQDNNLDFGSNVNSLQIEETMSTPKIARMIPKVTLLSSSHRKGMDNYNNIGDNFKSPQLTDKYIHPESLSFKFNRNARILGTASSKLSYLGSRLLEHMANGIKSLIFFEFEDNAYHLLELLDVLGVPYILYAHFIKQSDRATNLSDFSNYDTKLRGGITLIMDLKLAAHGLTVVAATHVYFINPIWKKSLEAQAIKRAHRIGQTKDVYVETLILKDTLEEEIYKQSSETSGKFLMDNVMMQKYILNHKFLDIGSEELEYVPFVAPTNYHKPLKGPDFELGEEEQEFRMATHSDSVTVDEKGNINRKWDVRVFTSDNLEKLNQAQAQKLRGGLKINELVDANERYEIETAKTRRQFPINEEPRKRVRF